MSDRLRSVHWAREQLGFSSAGSARNWLRRHKIRVVAGRFLESKFFAVWGGQDEDFRERARRAVS